MQAGDTADHWVQQFKASLAKRLERLELGNYSTAVSMNLVMILRGFQQGEKPDLMAKRVFRVEQTALTVPPARPSTHAVRKDSHASKRRASSPL